MGAFERFEHEYHTVRRAEGWGADNADYYRALPWRDLSGRFPKLWRIRARSFSALRDRVLSRLEARGALRVLDLGCGNGWLAYRLTQRGHQVAAIDVQLDPLDGLGAHTHYDASFTPVQAEFDRVPFADQQVTWRCSMALCTTRPTTRFRCARGCGSSDPTAAGDRRYARVRQLRERAPHGRRALRAVP